MKVAKITQNEYMQIIEDIVTAGSISGLPAEVKPDIAGSGATAEIKAAHAAVITAKSTIIANSISEALFCNTLKRRKLFAGRWFGHLRPDSVL